MAPLESPQNNIPASDMEKKKADIFHLSYTVLILQPKYAPSRQLPVMCSLTLVPLVTNLVDTK